eukprot:15721860-Heterocapsa_arctica.AAC.1
MPLPSHPARHEEDTRSVALVDSPLCFRGCEGQAEVHRGGGRQAESVGASVCFRRSEVHR